MMGSLPLRMTIAALPNFIRSRRSDNPVYVLAFALGTNIAVILLFVLASVYWRKDALARERLLLAAEQHQRRLMETAKDAHEKTIAYACHQLRCVACSTMAL
jgi:hypothetical protein